jgi:zinc protease
MIAASLRLPLLVALLAAGCAKSVVPETPAEAHPLDARPEIGEAVSFTPPTANTYTLENGVTVWHLPKPGLPLVSLRLLVPGGKAADPAASPGLTAFADDLLTRGAGQRDESAFAQALEELAIQLSVSTGDTHTWLALDAHSERLTEGLRLLTELVVSPRFDGSAIERVREQRLGQLAEAKADPRSVASMLTSTLYYGANHPLGHAAVGTEPLLKTTQRKALTESWTNRAVPARALLIVVGGPEPTELRDVLKASLGTWKSSSKSQLPAIPPPATAVGWYLVDDPGSTQSVLRVILPGPAPTEPAFAAADLAGVVLGGTFTSRLNRLLREEKGYTYGARAQLSDTAGYGSWLASTNVRTDVTGDALAALLGELRRMNDGIDEAELRKAQGAAQTRLVGSLESTSDIADAYATEAAAGRGPGALADALAARLAATEAEVDASAPLPLDRAVVLVVGDLATIRADVEAKVPAAWQVLERP